MLQFIRSPYKWWQKPLVNDDGKYLPAELVILKRSLSDSESGAWINSRGTQTAVVDLAIDSYGKFNTVRQELPDFVQECLQSFYAHPDISKGVFDLVIWCNKANTIRFVEVKCAHWDRPTPEQEMFAEIAHDRGIKTSIAEWEFKPHN